MEARRRVAAVVMGVGALGLATWLLPVRAWLAAIPEATEAAGWWGMVAFTAVYAVATIAALPVSVLTLGAGLAWGPMVGFAVVWPGAVLGAVGAFLLGRTALREVVARRVHADPRFAAVDDAVARDGAKLTFLLRLSPVFPFSALNYGLGVTRIGLGAYTLATAIGILPGTFMYVYVGSIGGRAAGDPGTPGERALFWGGLAATVAVTILVTRIARRALHAQVDLDEPDEAAAEADALELP